MSDSRTNERRPAPVSKPVALTVAGSDSGGGAMIRVLARTPEELVERMTALAGAE